MSPKEPEEHAWGRWIAIAIVCFTLIAVTRWPLVPTRHLFHIDNVNFALALDDFDPPRGRPQPPGDPMYVALTRWMRPFMPSAEILFPVSGILGSCAALVAMWWLGEMLLGWQGGALAALLLAVNPVFWLAGVGNYVRVYLALGAAIVAGLVWKSLGAEVHSKGSTLYFCASAAALGLFAGFRPEMGVLLLPLIAIPALWRRAKLWQWLAAAAWGVATTLPWLLFAARHSGGLLSLYRLNSAYLSMQSRHYSLFYGATFKEAGRMALTSIYWNLLGAVPWAPFLLKVRDRLPEPRLAWFLATWFVPPFLFYTFVHIHNADHALVAIPAVCMAGAWVLTRLPARLVPWAAAAALAGNVVLFFYPQIPPFYTANYGIAERTIHSADRIYARVGLFEKLGPVSVLWSNGYITPTEIGYYYPNARIFNVASEQPELYFQNKYETPRSDQGDVLIPAGKVIWLDSTIPAEAGCFAGLPASVGGELGSEREVHWANVPPGARFYVCGRWIRAVDPEMIR